MSGAHFKNAANNRSAFNNTAFRIMLACVTVFAVEAFLFNWKFWRWTLFSAGVPAALSISKTRILILFVLVAAFSLFRPKSAIWKTTVEGLSKKGKALAVAAFLVLGLSVSAFSQLSGQAEWLESGAVYNTGIEAIQDGNQYNHLADALLHGSVSLDLPVADILLDMDNPYDTPTRIALNKSERQPIYWDYAFYDGQYYCYFGIIPCLLTFLPVKALLGMDLRTDIAVIIFVWFALLAALYVLRQLQKTFYKDLSLGLYVVGFILLVGSSGILEQAFLPRIYPLPILSALAFALFGLGLWIKAKRVYRDTGVMNKAILAGGSFCAAATLGCRPQYVLVAVLALPLFYSEIKQRVFFSRKGLANTLAVILPFVVMFIPLGLYNYVRFDSPFDFGASYNLTGADMTAYQFIPEKIQAQVLEYLFLPFQHIDHFPFITTINDSPLSAVHPELKTTERFYAGFVYLTPAVIVVVGLISKRLRAKLPSRDIVLFSITSIILALLIIVIASYVSGTNMRYFADFAWLLLIPAIIAYWTLCSTGGRLQPVATCAFCVLTFLGIALYGWTFLGVERFGNLATHCPTIFNAMRNAVVSVLP